MIRSAAPIALLVFALGAWLAGCTVNTDPVAGEAPPPAARMSIGDARVDEGDAGAIDVTFTVSLDRATEGPVTVDYSTVDGTAATGIDFLGRTGQLTFEPGQTSLTVTVPVVGDAIREGDETFRLELSNLTGAEFELAGATATIVDDDPFPQLQVADASASEADADTLPLTFLVNLTAAPEVSASVDYVVAPGTASPDSDYETVEGTLTFGVGVASQTITVNILDDDFEEGPESVVLRFDNAVNAVLPEGAVTGTILDDDDDSDGVGLVSRPTNDTCLAGPTPQSSTQVVLTDAFPELPAFASPVQLVLPPAPAGDDMAPPDSPPPAPTVWYVVERGGRVYRYDSSVPAPPDALPEDPPAGLTLFLDISDRVDASGEGGLLSLAFHPDHANNGYVYASYTAPGAPLVSVLSRFALTAPAPDPQAPALDPASEQVLLTLDQPLGNHNGGRIGFGSDGLLYVAFGDGGGAGDPEGRAQDLTSLFGSILRLDVDLASPYAIPADNPFAGNPTCGAGGLGAAPCPEIWAWGFRNPWQWQFDDATGRLWVGDVGQNAVEEIDVVRGGGNYGWPVREGSRCFPADSDCDDVGLVAPVAEYAHAQGLGRSVTGGFVYRGTAMPTLAGRYVFADFVSGRILALALADDGGYEVEPLTLDAARAPVSFTTDPAGELYVTDIASGRFLRVEAGSESTANAFPDTLAATGCFATDDPAAFAEAVIPYATLVDGFTEAATPTKGFAIPDGTLIDAGLAPDGNGDWTLPASWMAVQTLSLDDAPVETRILARHADGRLRGYTYAWDDAGRTATRVRGGAVINLGAAEMLDGPLWYYPSENECLACHLGPAGGTLGLESAQLNFLFTYGPRRANQLTTLEGIGMFDAPLPAAATDLPAFPDLDDTEETLTRRARAWLHVNCSSCHRPGGTAPGSMDLRFEQSVELTGTCGVTPVRGDLGVADARIVAPGDVDRSVLVQRVATDGVAQMPPVGTRVTDSAGLALVSAWVSAMGPDCLVPDEDDVGIIIAPPPGDEPPDDVPDPEALSRAAFEQTLYPLLTTNCQSCHGGTGPGAPAFAHPVAAIAHEATLDNMLVDFMVPAASRFVSRLAVDQHECWSDCAADAAAVQAQVQAWADLLATPPDAPGP